MARRTGCGRCVFAGKRPQWRMSRVNSMSQALTLLSVLWFDCHAHPAARSGCAHCVCVTLMGNECVDVGGENGQVCVCLKCTHHPLAAAPPPSPQGTCGRAACTAPRPSAHSHSGSGPVPRVHGQPPSAPDPGDATTRRPHTVTRLRHGWHAPRRDGETTPPIPADRGVTNDSNNLLKVARPRNILQQAHSKHGTGLRQPARLPIAVPVAIALRQHAAGSSRHSRRR